MKTKACLFFILFYSFTQILFAQTDDKKDIYHSIGNTIDFLINSQETDELYNLANDQLKSQISSDQFAKAMSQIYQLGRIQSLELDSINEQKAIFTLEFRENALQMNLAIDENNKIVALKFKPIQKAKVAIAEPALEPSPVEKESDPIDLIIQDQSKAFLNNNHEATLSIGLLNNNRIRRYVYTLDQGKIQTHDTLEFVYELGDLSHIFVATLLATLSEKGEINLDDPIFTLLPDSVQTNQSLNSITFRELADYSAGIPNIELVYPDLNKQLSSYKNLSYDGIYSFLKNIDLRNQEYKLSEPNSLSYALLTDLISKKLERPFDELLQQEVISPIQLSHTAQLHQFMPEELDSVYKQNKVVERLQFDALQESAGIQSSLEDMISFSRQQLIFAENPIQKGMALTRDFSAFDKDDQIVGLGWSTTMINGTICYYISGHTEGSSAYLAVIPDLKSSVIVLSNARLDTQQFSRKILEVICE